jgi:hypothetical protein
LLGHECIEPYKDHSSLLNIDIGAHAEGIYEWWELNNRAFYWNKKDKSYIFYAFLYMNSHKNTHYMHLISHTIYWKTKIWTILLILH